MDGETCTDNTRKQKEAPTCVACVFDGTVLIYFHDWVIVQTEQGRRRSLSWRFSWAIPALFLDGRRLDAAAGAQDVAAAAPGLDEVVDGAAVVLGLAHVGEAGATGAMGTALDDVDGGDGARVDLEPALDAGLGELAAQQDGGFDAGAAHGQTDAGKGVAAGAAGRHQQHVAGLGAVGVLAREEAAAGAGGIHAGDLLLVVGADDVDAGRLGRRGGW